MQAPTEDYSLIYASPEYINSMNCNTMKALTPKSDVFSFAKVSVYMSVCVGRRVTAVAVDAGGTSGSDPVGRGLVRADVTWKHQCDISASDPICGGRWRGVQRRSMHVAARYARPAPKARRFPMGCDGAWM